MSSDDYEAYCAMPTDDDESHNRLHAGLAKFGLKQLQLPPWVGSRTSRLAGRASRRTFTSTLLRHTRRGESQRGGSVILRLITDAHALCPGILVPNERHVFCKRREVVLGHDGV